MEQAPKMMSVEEQEKIRRTQNKLDKVAAELLKRTEESAKNAKNMIKEILENEEALITLSEEETGWVMEAEKKAEVIGTPEDTDGAMELIEHTSASLEERIK